MVNILLIAIIAVVVGLAALYIIKAKRNGRKCIGCPESCNCGSCSGCCGKT